ncbi:MAG: hypothetical protein OXG15_07300 [Gammaproteobacteria bacterium]|nr:hypothetical protein [Gammaproteobacteria bacterium]
MSLLLLADLLGVAGVGAGRRDGVHRQVDEPSNRGGSGWPALVFVRGVGVVRLWCGCRLAGRVWGWWRRMELGASCRSESRLPGGR